MTMQHTSANSRTWTVALVIAGAAAVWFLWPQLGVIVLTALMAFMFYPLYLKLKHKKKGNGAIAAVLTLAVSFLVVIIPLTFVIMASVAQLAQLADIANKQAAHVPAFVENVVNAANTFMEKTTGSDTIITGEGAINFLRSSVGVVARTVVDVTLGIISGLPQLGIALIIYIFLFVELLMHGPKLVRKAAQLSPFDVQTTEKYIERMGLMANAMVKGQLIIAMVLSLIAVLLLLPLGYGSYAFLFFIVFTVLNFIPLGSGIVVVPLVAYSMMTGQFWLGLAVIIVFYASGNLDPLMRAKLIPKQIQQSVAVTMVATFCGIAYFGMLGVVYGPIIMLMITTTFEFYAEYKRTRTAKAL